MPALKSIIVLSEKSSGSSAFQNLLSSFATVRHVRRTRHYENETLYWTKAASVLGMPQLDMVDSEVPIGRDKARTDLVRLLEDNVPGYTRPQSDRELIMQGWRLLCETHAPTFLEKSPHHLCQWSALELITECMRELPAIDFLLVGLVRNPMDTIYSQYRRWKSPPEKVERQWRVAYRNLLRLKASAGEQLVMVRYEDMIASLAPLAPVLDFCGSSPQALDPGYFHGRSVSKWKYDRLFGFTLSQETIELAETYGYQHDELRHEPKLLWPVIRECSRATYKAIAPLKHFARYARQRSR